MELIQAQITAIIALGLGTLAIGLIPAFISSRGRQKWPLLISALLCFGGGILLSTSLLHLLPEVRKGISKYCIGTKTAFKLCYNDYYAELIMCAGFLLLYLIDEIVHFFYGVNHHPDHFHSEMENCTHSTFSEGQPSTSYGSSEETPLYRGGKQAPYNPNFRKTASLTDLRAHSPPPSQLCHVGHEQPCDTTTSAISKIGLLVALSVHAMIEGLAVGLESETRRVLLLLGAIASHKLVVSFCLGLEIAVAPGKTLLGQFTSIAVFAMGSVGGIGLGMAVRHWSVGISELPIAIMQGVAAGTLLYVTLSEILPRERASWHQHQQRRCAGVIQFFTFTFGYVIMFLLIAFLDID